MLIRILTLALPLVACLDREPVLGEQQADLICGSLCDPPYSDLLHDTWGCALRLFPDAGYTYYEGCGAPDGPWECTLTIQTGATDGSCARIDCAQHRPCSWSHAACQ
jgi:hypothetical protein